MSDNYDFREAAAIFGIFHNVWFKAPAQEFLGSLSKGVIQSWPTRTEIESKACDAISQSLQTNSLEEIQADHFRLLIGGHRKLAYPWGSVYTDPEGVMFGDTTQAFKAFCHAHGIEFELPYRQPLDHIGIIMASLSGLFSQKSSPQTKKAIQELLGEHLLPWIERFMMSVELNANTGYYRGFSNLMREQVDYWAKQYGAKAKEIKLFR